MDDLAAQYRELFALHGQGPFDVRPEGQRKVSAWSWDEVLAEVSDPAERDHLAALAQLTREHPVRLRLVNGLVELEAPLAWRVGHAEVYAGACLRLWHYGAEAVRKHLLPRLAGR
ncbi:MAG: hypothetical protein ACOZHQ_14010 [Thermodesulfobacteriota bacterium]